MDFNKYVKDTGRIIKANNNGTGFTILHKNNGFLGRNRSYGIETITHEGSEVRPMCFYNIQRLRDAEKIYKWVLREIEMNQKVVAL